MWGHALRWYLSEYLVNLKKKKNKNRRTKERNIGSTLGEETSTNPLQTVKKTCHLTNSCWQTIITSVAVKVLMEETHLRF